MASTSIEPFLKGDTGRNTRGLLRLIILCTIAGAAVASRLFSVISKTLQRPFDTLSLSVKRTTALMLAIGFESIIHECQYCFSPVEPVSVHRPSKREQSLICITLQSIRGSTSGRQSTWCRMGSIVFGTGLTIVSSLAGTARESISTHNATHSSYPLRGMCKRSRDIADMADLVRNMASARPCYRWHPLPWSHGHQWHHTPCSPTPVVAG